MSKYQSTVMRSPESTWERFYIPITFFLNDEEEEVGSLVFEVEQDPIQGLLINFMLHGEHTACPAVEPELATALKDAYELLLSFDSSFSFDGFASLPGYPGHNVLSSCRDGGCQCESPAQVVSFSDGTLLYLTASRTSGGLVHLHPTPEMTFVNAVGQSIFFGRLTAEEAKIEGQSPEELR